MLRTAETLKDYAFEAAYLNQMNNEARYLINGKGIVRRDDGSLLFFAVEDDEIEFFHFGGTILDEHLTELTYMDKEEVKQLDIIRSLDEKLYESFGLHVVSPVYDNNLLKDVIIINPNTMAFYQLDLMDIDNIDSNTVGALNIYEGCALNNPYRISVAEDGTVIDKG